MLPAIFPQNRSSMSTKRSLELREGQIKCYNLKKMVTLDLKQYILISVQTWLSAELAEECCSVCFCFKETPDLHPLRKIRHRAFGIIVFHRKSFTFWSLSLLCLHWPAGGEVFINFCCPPGLTPTPGPPLSAPDEKTSCTNSGA